MQIGLSDEQKLLSDSVGRFIAQEYEFNTRRRIVDSAQGFLDEHWSTFAELGWLAAPIPEQDGGLGGSLEDTAVIMEGLGRGLFAGPYLSSVLLAGGLIARAGSDAQKTQLLPALMRGERRFAFAFAEPQSRYDLANVSTRARKEGDHVRISGRKSVVLYASCADSLILSVRTAGGTLDREGISLFLLDKNTQGLHERGYATVDGQRASEVDLDNVRADPTALLGQMDCALPVIEDVCDRATLALCAEAVGCLEALYDNTLVYLKQREQFGASIGSFQALQHRMVDVFMNYELSRALCYAAARGIDQAATMEERKRWASAAKVQIGKAGRDIAQEAVQLHGGMGMTDELSVGHYFKRLTAINATLGNEAHHLKRFRELESAATTDQPI